MKPRSRRRGGGRGRGRGRPAPKPARAESSFSFWNWLKGLFAPPPQAQRKLPAGAQPSDSEARVLEDFSRQFQITFERPDLLKLALTHRSYLSVTGQSARESNERLEFLGDSVLGLVTSEFLYREHPTEHEGQLTKTKSLLVSKAILSRRALAMGLGKYVLMSRSESDSGGRQRLSILADAFESVLGAIYLDQGFEASRAFIMRWLLRDTREIVADKRHANYKSHLQEYVQSTFRTHPVYRIRSEMGPDHSKQFNVEVLVGRRVLGTGRGRNKKDAEQSAARDALSQAEGRPRSEDPKRPVVGAEAPRPARERETARRPRDVDAPRASREPEAEHHGQQAPQPSRRGEERDDGDEERELRRRGRRGGRGRRGRSEDGGPSTGVPEPSDEPGVPSDPRREARPEARPDSGRPERERPAMAMAPPPSHGGGGARSRIDDEGDEEGRPEGSLEERRVDPWDEPAAPRQAPAGAPEGGERFTGGRTVERLGRTTWYDAPESEAPSAPARGERERPEYEPERSRRRGHEDTVTAREAEPPQQFEPDAASTLESDAVEPESTRAEESLPQEPAGGAPSPAPAFGRKRGRR